MVALAPLSAACCIAGSFGEISSAMLESERRCGLVSGVPCAGGPSVGVVAAPDLAAASRACCCSN
jgi:hypothetical protein